MTHQPYPFVDEKNDTLTSTGYTH